MTLQDKTASVYLEASLPCVSRLLGLMDRNPSSLTYGCFDRNYWHYKIIDFSNGRLQEAGLTLALLFVLNHPLNPYYHQKKIKKWSLAAMHFLKTIQNTDGSFNEYYPHEHAFVTTAFSTFAVSESLLLLNEFPAEVLEMLKKSGRWLLEREELDVVNQNLGACAALQNVYLLTGENRFKKGAYTKLKDSLHKQSPEGWFYEYGGPDIGYLSVAVYYLANYYKKTQDKTALLHLRKAVRFLSHFVHPDGSAGGEYGSRNTMYMVPDGIEICAQHDDYAGFLASSLRTSLKGGGIAPFDLDDRYLCTMLYPYLQAYSDCSPIKKEKEPESSFFSESGLLVEKTSNSLFIVNLKKGGVFKLFSKGGLVLSDSGFLGRLSNGSMVSSQWLGTTFTKTGSHYSVTGPLVVVPEHQVTPFKTMVLRGSLSLGGKYVSDFAKHYLRRKLITQKNTVSGSFQRKITLKDENAIHITDMLEGKLIFDSLHLVDHASLIYIPSSRYFCVNELHTPQYLTEDLSTEFNRKKKVVYERDIICEGS